MRQQHPDTVYGIVPEFEHHEVRYAAYAAKLPKVPRLPLPEREQNAEPDFNYDVAFGMFDREEDDHDEVLNLACYIDPDIEKIEQEKKKKALKKPEVELSLDSVYDALHAMNINAVQKIILQSKKELMEAEKKPPNKKRLTVITPLYRTMFNPNQKLAIHTAVREALCVPPHEFRKYKYIYTVILPEAALIVFQKKFKIDTTNNALGILAGLELLNPTFYSNKYKTDLHCRT